ncbi:MAG: hypothetical protein ACI87E_004313 [Mariniblastus sp.]|jgi:hypothetical protein
MGGIATTGNQQYCSMWSPARLFDRWIKTPMDLDNLMMLSTRWSIRSALLCLWASLLLRQIASRPKTSTGDAPTIAPENDREPKPLAREVAKHLWLLGSFASLLHAITTMVFFHGGSHELAFEDTAQKTEQLLGIRVGLGIYCNYAFVIAWLFDAIWWISSSRSYLTRHRAITWTVIGFLLFIAINGAIVFEQGIVRWVALAGLVQLSLTAWLMNRRPARL